MDICREYCILIKYTLYLCTSIMKKILIVDDEPSVREVLSDFLIMSGYEVITAANGQIALDFFEKETPDMAIVDVEMPVMNGLQFSKKLLATNPRFPIIIMTAFFDKYKDTELKNLPVEAILPKPLDLRELSATIKHALEPAAL